jgi:hypothetical protein
MQLILNDLAYLIRDGARLRHGDVFTGVIPPYDLTVIGPADDASSEAYPLNVVNGIYPHASPAKQVVWPDAEGRYPWQPGYTMEHHQPLLASPPASWEPQ